MPEIQQEPLYERFRKMKLAKFVGSADPLEAKEWLSLIETILDFMQLSDHEWVLCASYMLRKDARHWWEMVKLRKNVNAMTWAEFIGEFNQKYYNPTALKAQHNEFLNLKQGSMTIVEAVQKFEQLARLCHFLANTKEERLRRMMDMFHLDITLAIESGGSPLTTVAKCVERAILVKYRLAQLKEDRARNFEARNKNQWKENGDNQAKGSNRGSKPN